LQSKWWRSDETIRVLSIFIFRYKRFIWSLAQYPCVVTGQ
jgi:hypothetical protein